MTDDKRRKYDPPLRLDMDFKEGLVRFGQTDPKEMRELIERIKRKKSPRPKAPTTKGSKPD